MLDELAKLNIKTCSDSELIALLRQTFPIFMEAYQRFCSSEPISCKNCSQKTKCEKLNRNKFDITCLILEPSLPGKYEGTGYREKHTGLMIEEYTETDNCLSEDAGDDIDVRMKLDKSTLKSIRKTKLDEEFMLYKNCPTHIFRPEQWEAVCLRFEYGLKQQEIAEMIGVTRSAVSDRLRRAKKNMEKYYFLKNVNVISRQIAAKPSTYIEEMFEVTNRTFIKEQIT